MRADKLLKRLEVASSRTKSSWLIWSATFSPLSRLGWPSTAFSLWPNKSRKVRPIRDHSDFLWGEQASYADSLAKLQSPSVCKAERFAVWAGASRVASVIAALLHAASHSHST